MKTKLRFKALSILITLVLGILIGSCTKEESINAPESDPVSNLTLKSAWNFGADNVECSLIAGQSINAGNVIFSHDATNLYITYVSTGGWYLTELHLYVGDLAGLPTNNKAIQIGHFPYSATNLIGLTTYTFTVPIADVTKDANGYTIAAHAIVVNGKQEETAWSNCSYAPVIAVKTLILNGYWAVSDGDFIPNPDNYGCRIFATNVYEKDDVYPLIGPYYPTPGQAGHVNVTDDGKSLFITVQASENYKLLHSYLYVGTMPGFLGYIDISTCVDYKEFPYQMDTPGGEENHEFVLPLPNVSFQTAFNSNRWGWINHYNF